MTDSSIEFVGLVALCSDFPSPLVSLSLSRLGSRSLSSSSYVKRLAHTSLGTAALWTFSVPYIVYTGCNCARETALSPIFTDTEYYFLLSARLQTDRSAIHFAHVSFLLFSSAFSPMRACIHDEITR